MFVRSASLDGFFPVSFHVLLYVLHLLFTRLVNQDGIQQSSFDIVPVLSLSNRIQLLQNLSTFTPPTALLQYLGCQVEGSDLRSSCHVHRGKAWSASPICCRRPSQISVQILTTVGAFQLSGNMRKLTRSPSHLSLCKNQAPLLICSCYKTAQDSMHLPHPMTSFGHFLRISHKISR